MSAPGTFSYPSTAPGLPALELEAMLNAHAELLRRIKICYGADRERFEHEIMEVVRRYAAYVHLLPATADNYFNVPGGLLQCGLEIAFFALQGTDAHIFSGRASITTRRHLEPRWRLATFIGGLCSEIHRTLSRIVVTDDAGNEWPAYLTGLHPWIQLHGTPRYFLKWRPSVAETPGISLFCLPHIVPASTLQHLGQGNAVVVPHLLASLSGVPLAREHNILDQLVRRSSALVIDRYLRASADRCGKPQRGSHLERHLLDGIRRLIASDPSWQPNSERSRVWFGEDGLFFIWPGAAADVRKLLEADQLPGIPKEPQTMLEILLDAGVVEAPGGDRTLWAIQPLGAKQVVEAVKLSNPHLVLVGLEPKPTPLGQALAVSPAHRIGASTAMQPTARSDSPSPPPPSSEPPSTPALTLPVPAALSALAATDPEQLDLLLPATRSRDAGGDQPERPACSVPPGILRLRAPLRLNSSVRMALEHVVDAINTGHDVAAKATPQGLIVAETEFSRRNVAPVTAARALAECGMLVANEDAKGIALPSTFGGAVQRAITIAAAHVASIGVDSSASEGA